MRRFAITGILAMSAAVTGCAGSTHVYPLFPAEATTAQSRGFETGYRFENGVDVPRNYERAIEEYERASKFGDAKATNNLGVMAMKGQGVSLSRSSAMSYFKKAAELGSSSAHFNMGLLFESGFQGSYQPGRAAEEYRIAAEMGHSEAQYRLSILLETKEAISLDPNEWRRMLDMAVANGNKSATERVEGIIKPTDVTRYLSSENCKSCGSTGEFKMADRSLKGLSELAAAGDPSAQYNLAVKYLNANGANLDPSEAARLFTLSARQGYAPAQRQLAQMYLRGQAVGKSKVIAHSWLNLAARDTGADGSAAKAEMEALEQSMSVTEIEDAQDLAAQGANRGR